MRLSPLATAILITALASCAPSPTVTVSDGTQASELTPLARGIVRTDGRSDLALSAAGTASCTSSSSAQIATGLASTNAARAARGLRPLTANASLQRAAERHACDMAQRGLMTHTSANGNGVGARVRAAGYRPRVTAENIAAGRLSYAQVLNEWNSSPGHASNLMRSDITHFGIGSAVGSDNKTVYWVAVYAGSM